MCYCNDRINCIVWWELWDARGTELWSAPNSPFAITIWATCVSGNLSDGHSTLFLGKIITCWGWGQPTCDCRCVEGLQVTWLFFLIVVLCIRYQIPDTNGISDKVVIKEKKCCFLFFTFKEKNLMIVKQGKLPLPHCCWRGGHGVLHCQWVPNDDSTNCKAVDIYGIQLYSWHQVKNLTCIISLYLQNNPRDKHHYCSHFIGQKTGTWRGDLPKIIQSLRGRTVTIIPAFPLQQIKGVLGREVLLRVQNILSR